MVALQDRPLANVFQSIGGSIPPLVESFDRGKTIFFPGDPAERVYFLRRGAVKLSRVYEAGEEITVAVTPEAITLDSEDDFEAVIISMIEKHREKSTDYSGDDHPNQNFYDSARQLGLTGGHSVEQLIATKQARLGTLPPIETESHRAGGLRKKSTGKFSQ